MEDRCYNREYVGKVIEQFMDLTYNDFAAHAQPDLVEAGTGAIFDINNVGEMEKENFTYTDMCILLDDIGRNKAYTTYVGRTQRILSNTEVQRFVLRMWNEMLFSASESLIGAKLFMVLPMEWFCHYITESASDEQAVKREVDMIKELVNEVYQTVGKELRCSATIEEVLEIARGVAREYWKLAGDSLESYKRCILSAHRVIAHLLVYSFKMAYPERFGIEDTWNE